MITHFVTHFYKKKWVKLMGKKDVKIDKNNINNLK